MYEGRSNWGGVGRMELWLADENGPFSRDAGVCCMELVVAADSGSEGPVGDARVREVADGAVCMEEDDDGGRGLVSSG